MVTDGIVGSRPTASRLLRALEAELGEFRPAGDVMRDMTAPAFASFVRDAERLTDNPHAIARRLRALLAVDGWLAPQHQRPGHDGYRQHLLHVSASRRLSVLSLVWLPGQRTPI